MKTIEQKVKAHDEALTKARMYRDNAKAAGDYAAVARYENIFPELAESEDERIRKYLIYELKAANSVGELKFSIPQPTREECISYLERQKEQKTKKFPFLLGDAIPYDEGYNKGYEDAMKEQKSAEWSDKDKNIFNLALNLIKHSDDCDGILDKDLAVKWFAELPSRFVPQPKQEWSEEDENNLNKLLQWDGIPLGLRSWVSGLPEKVGARPSWKPSRLEKAALRTAIYILTEERNFPKAAKQLQNILNAFEDKESRKDWKPSEEQMKALHEAVIRSCSYEYGYELGNLELDLKKL